MKAKKDNNLHWMTDPIEYHKKAEKPAWLFYQPCKRCGSVENIFEGEYCKTCKEWFYCNRV